MLKNDSLQGCEENELLEQKTLTPVSYANIKQEANLSSHRAGPIAARTASPSSREAQGHPMELHHLQIHPGTRSLRS